VDGRVSHLLVRRQAVLLSIGRCWVGTLRRDRKVQGRTGKWEGDRLCVSSVGGPGFGLDMSNGCRSAANVILGSVSSLGNREATLYRLQWKLESLDRSSRVEFGGIEAGPQGTSFISICSPVAIILVQPG
jgi:hypothetical protein